MQGYPANVWFVKSGILDLDNPELRSRNQMQNPPYDWNPESKFVQTGRTESGRRTPESKTDLDNLTLNWYLFLLFFFSN